jgi:hypothetical protein
MESLTADGLFPFDVKCSLTPDSRRIIPMGLLLVMMGGRMRRAEMIAELGGSVIITAITGIYTFGGLALAGYIFLTLHSSPNALGMIPLLFSVVNLPLFIIWGRETIHEISTRADSNSIEYT